MSKNLPPLVLASASPRRRELLAGLGLDFSVRTVDFEEHLVPGEAPLAAARRLAIGKVRAHVDPGSVVLAADTIVVLEDRILGKPRDASDARSMLRDLAGREHAVLTGVAFCHGERLVAGVDSTRVQMTDLDDEEIGWYVGTGEPRGKAGAYAIQGLGALFIEAIEGNYSNVVGLPLPLVDRLAGELGWSLRAWSS
jgi:septum formation protein